MPERRLDEDAPIWRFSQNRKKVYLLGGLIVTACPAGRI
jgi:hypothetical protein